jgi:hypothetical protein
LSDLAERRRETANFQSDGRGMLWTQQAHLEWLYKFTGLLKWSKRANEIEQFQSQDLMPTDQVFKPMHQATCICGFFFFCNLLSRCKWKFTWSVTSYEVPICVGSALCTQANLSSFSATIRCVGNFSRPAHKTRATSQRH